MLIKNCCEYPEFELEFVGATWKPLRMMAQVGIANPGGFLSEEQSKQWGEKKKKIENLSQESPRLTIETLARKVGLEAWYAYFFRMSSFHAHSSFVSLALRHLDFDASGKISIDAAPRDKEFRMLSATLVEHIIISVDALLRLYDLMVREKLHDLRQEHELLVSKDLEEIRERAGSRA